MSRKVQVKQRVPTGRFLLVQLEPDLHPSRITGIYCRIVQTPGVVSCEDLALRSFELLASEVLLEVQPGA